ncbi:hypothetical protein, conserved [Babesia ovata]|uniref:Uncharacterized protein n=1 Tax=Babesia ovata TaxID=189622 RepID=A0A2H6KAT2_9APIC|nr:uncharacterized protein BOVATA_016000 [Babesia ovata]GBE60107.1 hypothetical protein, conserved [Babesia ovata]
MAGEESETSLNRMPRVNSLIHHFQRQRGSGEDKGMVSRDSVTRVEIQAQASTDSLSESGSRRFGIDNRILYHNISPSNRLWLRIYKYILNLGVLFLIVAYTFYIVGLFEPILYLDAGEFTDPDVFQPFNETLLHSLKTLYKQKAYFTVIIAGMFSITLPFVKMIVTTLAYVIAVAHRRSQLLLFFGEKPIDKSGIRTEDEGNIKYAREMLMILKLISKFQMVDVVVLLLNAVFLRCAFVWARPAKGLLYLVIYCLFSIAGAQLVNFAVEGEKDIFDSWWAIKYAIVPRYLSIRSSTSFHAAESVGDKAGIQPLEKKRWFVSEDFICVMAGVNILSCISLMTNEKLLTVGFTIEKSKTLVVDSSTLSYTDMLMNLLGMDYGAISMVVLFFLCIVFPMLFSIFFLASVFGYNWCMRNRSVNGRPVEITDTDDTETRLDYEWDIRLTRFIFKFCNMLSEWSCGEVVALATMAAITSMNTADRVTVTIPPKKTCSALFMMGAYGVSSFLLTAAFYIWNQNVKLEFSHIRIYVKYLESPNRGHMARLMSDNQFTDDSIYNGSMGRPVVRTTSPRQQSPVRRHFPVPCLESMRRVLYSKWLSGTFFGLLTGVAILLTMSAYTLTYPSPHVNMQAVSGFLTNDIKEIYGLVRKQVPQSIGQCGFDDFPPDPPCIGAEPLMVTQNRLHMSVVWFSGMKTIDITSAEYFLSAERRMTFKFIFNIEKLKTYVRLAAVEQERLKNMIAGVIETGIPFDVEAQISMKCVNRSPQMRDLRVDHIVLRDFVVKGKWYQGVSALIDIPAAIGTWCTREANRLLHDPKQVIMWRGISFDVAEFLNLVVSQNWPTNFICPTNDG